MLMNIFDMIGPVMIGPSSSHTAGAVRIGRITRALLGEQPVEVVIGLHGSFARTYKGHGTDRALIGGLMGMLPDDPNIRHSMQLAEGIGLKYRFEPVTLKDAHPNTARIEAVGRSGKKMTVLGSSVGGGNIVIKQINGLSVEVTAAYPTLVIAHKDTPGAVAAVTKFLADNDINIAQMNVYRSERRGNAMMVIETDEHVDPKLIASIEKLTQITEVTTIKPAFSQ